MSLLAPQNIDVRDLPCIPITDLHLLPVESGLYFVINQDHLILYIGQTKSLLTRWMTHHRRKLYLDDPSLKLAWILVPITDLIDTEEAFITYFNPRDNGVNVPNKGYKTIILRIPDSLHEQFRALAAMEYRTLQGQLLHLVETWMERTTHSVQERRKALSS